MAKDPDTVAKFLSDLAEKLQPLWKNEKEEMLKLKEEEVRSLATLLFYMRHLRCRRMTWSGHSTHLTQTSVVSSL